MKNNIKKCNVRDFLKELEKQCKKFKFKYNIKENIEIEFNNKEDYNSFNNIYFKLLNKYEIKEFKNINNNNANNGAIVLYSNYLDRKNKYTINNIEIKTEEVEINYYINEKLLLLGFKNIIKNRIIKENHKNVELERFLDVEEKLIRF